MKKWVLALSFVPFLRDETLFLDANVHYTCVNE